MILSPSNKNNAANRDPNMSMMSENPMIMEEKAENIGNGWNRKFAS